jgi:hypothetical protein
VHEELHHALRAMTPVSKGTERGDKPVTSIRKVLLNTLIATRLLSSPRTLPRAHTCRPAACKSSPTADTSGLSLGALSAESMVTGSSVSGVGF